MVEKDRLKYTDIVILSDFNVDMNNTTNKLDPILEKYLLKNIVTQNTRNQSLIDLCLTDNNNFIRELNIVENLSHTCDHLAIKLKLHVPRIKPKTKFRKIIPKSNHASFEFEYNRLLNEFKP